MNALGSSALRKSWAVVERFRQACERAFDEGDSWLPYLRAEPLTDPLRSDPRFDDLLRRIGYPED